MSKNIPLVWVSHLKTPKDKEEFKQACVSSIALRRLADIIRQKLEAIESGETNYDTASWAYRQAHYNGKREALKEIDQLLSFVE